MRPTGAVRSLALLSMCCLAAVAGAEEVAGAGEVAGAEEKDKGWTNSTELSLVATSGNSETTTFSLKHTLGRDWGGQRFKLEVSGLRAESDTGTRFALGTPEDFEVIDPSQRELTAENYSLAGRFERDINEKLFWSAGGGWERNEFAGIDSRLSAEAGAGNVWFKSDGSHFLTHYTVTATRQDDVIETPGSSGTFLGVRLSWDFSKKLTPTTSYTNVLVVDENLDDTADLRASLDQSLTVAITARLALKVSLKLSYDNQPSLEALPLFLPDGSPSGQTVLVELDELDSIFGSALVIDF